ncbi:MAG TPA: RNase adapter RapZ [Terriglobales bacterium]|nr:RNase adapter RapZ [Terriglobales bacterium]
MPRRAARKPGKQQAAPGGEFHLVIITGLSGSGKGSVVKVFEDSGYYCVDNLPVGLLPRFIELVQQSDEISRVACVVDIREGTRLGSLPEILKELRQPRLRLTLLFLEASDEAIIRRFSETRRPHPLASRARDGEGQVKRGIAAERRALTKIRAGADMVIDTSKFNVHELRAFIQERVVQSGLAPGLQVGLSSFGFRNGVPSDADLVFDVRFLPNPNYIASLRPQTGRDPKVGEYIRSFPQTAEFLARIRDLLAYLIPHYTKEGKSYLNIAVGCTGGRHRSVYIAEALRKELRRLGYRPSLSHRDL